MGFLNIGKLRQAYRERVAPQSRSKFGNLERHKDYVQRAKDFHMKEKRLHKLRLAAATKNPDEFNRDMLKAQLKNGVHFEQQHQQTHNNKNSKQIRVRENTEDIIHLTAARTHQAKVIARMKESVSLKIAPNSTNHLPKCTVFVENDDERREVERKCIDGEKIPLAFRLKKDLLKTTAIYAPQDISLVDGINANKEKFLDKIRVEEEKLCQLDREISRLELTRKKITDSRPCIKVQAFQDEFGREDTQRLPVFRWVHDRKK